KHFFELSRALAAANIQTLTDDFALCATTVLRAFIQRQPYREQRITRRQFAHGKILILAIAAYLSARQDKPMAFVHGSEVARHRNVLAAGIVPGLRTVITQSAIKGTQESGETQQHQ